MQMGTIRVFCDIVRTKNFTRSAEWNDHNQSHASNMFRVLERAFGVRLAERHRGFFQLTPAGKILHRHFLEVLRLNDELELRMQETRDAAAGIIQLAACYSIGLINCRPASTGSGAISPRWTSGCATTSLTGCMRRCPPTRCISAWCAMGFDFSHPVDYRGVRIDPASVSIFLEETNIWSCICQNYTNHLLQKVIADTGRGFIPSLDGFPSLEFEFLNSASGRLQNRVVFQNKCEGCLAAPGNPTPR